MNPNETIYLGDAVYMQVDPVSNMIELYVESGSSSSGTKETIYMEPEVLESFITNLLHRPGFNKFIRKIVDNYKGEGIV